MSREEDAKVAELVMAGVRLPVIFEPTSKVYDDYEVLKHVRETWEPDLLEEFANELASVWFKRTSSTYFDFTDALNYEPGDYSLAALKVKEAE